MSNPEASFARVESALRLRHVSFDLAERRAFVEGAWPLARLVLGDLPAKWAEA